MAKKTDLTVVPDAVDTTEVKGKWATMRDQARAEYKPRPPYMFDGTEPPTPITAPDSADRSTALAALVDGNLTPGQLRRFFEVLCGDAFNDIWAVVGPEPVDVLWPLFAEINNHFQSVPGDEGDDVPGGASAS